MLRAVLSDDEPLALDRLADLVGRLPDIEIAATAGNGDETLAAVERQEPDIVFLDVEMPGLDGFDVVEELLRRESAAPLVVFVTAYPEFAAHAFDTGAIDFLTKPVRIGRLETAIERVRQAIEDRSARERLVAIGEQLHRLREERQTHIRRDRHLWVTRRGEMVRVDLDAVIFVQAEGEYVRLQMGDHDHLHREPISTLLTRLDPDRYVRIHRSYIVDRDRVVGLRRRVTGSYVVTLEDGTELPVGRSFRQDARAIVER
ncbi:LytR/AlgR family response regulator transcription factor [Stakelama marina]|uniref:Response regulator transcription factor n=1 Tax=Stakelama marina TaxID=2826939 RepID=A0A8T4IL22_9SPHN|nr:LytTR family DNA-binding domain-containing protein [Stakelama marina]MBR0553815.1 response regulator transcription factor [Stakelama marina]